MIDPKNQEERMQSHLEMIKMMTALEVIHRKRIAKVLQKQYVNAARLIEQDITNVDHAVNIEAGLMAETYIAMYNAVTKTFNKDFFRELKFIDKKDAIYEFTQNIRNWITVQTAQKVVKVQKTTKNLLRNLIQTSLSDGKTNREVAIDILKSGKVTGLKGLPLARRASLIARNEIHTAAVNAVDQSAKASRVKFEREWASIIDDRTHGAKPTDKWNHIIANGETVQMNETFVRTGEALMYPGDPKGSAANIIQCRCVIMYHRILGG